MKTIAIKNLIIQFDGKGKHPVAEAQQVIDLINKTLEEAELNCQPQIMAGGLDASDIEMEDSLNEKDALEQED
jgi:hypothetical protein